MNHPVGCIRQGTDNPLQGQQLMTSKHEKDTSGKDELSGKVTKFLYNPHGDTDGLLLDGLHQVHYPPHLSADVLTGVKIGDKVTAHGTKTPKTDLFVATSLTCGSRVCA